MPTRRALLIGINAYEHMRPLPGCVNDVRLMRAVLQEQFGFPEAQVTLLEDAQATRDGILGAFDALIAATGPDDIVVIHYAGHGAQMTDQEDDEPSGYDSTLQPVETKGWQAEDGRENTDITDDELALKLDALAARTRYITLIVDACHSGTITRDGSGPAARTSPPDRRPAEQLQRPKVPIVGRDVASQVGGSGWLPVTDRYVLIAGCRDDEISYEHFPPELGGNQSHGALTWFLVQALRSATPGTTYRDIFETAAAQVNAADARQHPQMEGQADRELFGMREFEPARFLRVTARSGDELTLAAGAAQGVTVGSTYGIQPPGAKLDDPDTALGVAVVRTVDVVTATADLLEEREPESIGPGMRAFVRTHALGELAQCVAIVDTPAEEAAALREALGASGMLDLVESAVPHALRVLRLPARTAVGADDPVPRAGPLAEPMWAVLGESGDLVAPLTPLADVARVRENLETLAALRQGLAIDNPDPGSRLRGRFRLELLTRDARGEWVDATPDPASGLVTYQAGDPIGFRVRTDLDRPVYVSLVHFEVTGQVSVLVPAAGVETQVKLDMPERMLGTGTVTWPKGFPFVDSPDHAREGEALETVKLFVTDEPTNFSVLARKPMRGEAPPATTALGALLHAAFNGRPMRGVAMDVPAERSDWTTVTKSYVVRRADRTALDGTARAHDLGEASVSAAGVTGRARTWFGGKGRREAGRQLTPALDGALAEASMAVARTVALEEVAVDAKPSRGGVALPPPRVTMRVPAPPAGHRQLLLATDELGLVRWVLPTRTAGRGGGTDLVRFDVPVPAPAAAPPGKPAGRGLVASIGSMLLKELVFPLIDPVIGEVTAGFVQRYEAAKAPYGMRRFDPGTHAEPSAVALDADGWAHLGTGRALLFVHGTFSRAHLAFGALPAPLLAELHARYGGRVAAFDHPTLSADPLANVREFVARMPDGLSLDLDIVCHSRGGLVARMFTEQLAQLPLGRRRIRVGQVVFVGSPNAGTGLADPQRVGDLLDVVTNLLNVLPAPGVGDVLGLVLGVLKQVAVAGFSGLDGLMAMDPDGAFATDILRPGRPTEGTRYRAIAADVTPEDPGLRRLVLERGMGAVLGGAHDLVVPTESVFRAEAGAGFPVADRLVLAGSEAIGHTRYFADERVRAQLLDWLRPG